MILFIIFIGITRVYAADNYTCNLEITADKTSIKPGETLTYEIKATNINAGSGIKTFEVYIDYNSNIFDCSVQSDDAGNWSRTGFLEGYLTMDKSSLEASSEDQVIAKVIFTAKTNVTVDNYQIKFSGMRFTAGDDSTFTISDKSANIQIISSQKEGDTTDENSTSENTTGESTVDENTLGENTVVDNNTTRENTIGNTTSENTISINTTDTNISDTNTSNGNITEGNTSNKSILNEDEKTKSREKLPYTGGLGTIEKVLIAVVLVVLTIWSYIRYKKY